MGIFETLRDWIPFKKVSNESDLQKLFDANLTRLNRPPSRAVGRCWSCPAAACSSSSWPALQLPFGKRLCHSVSPVKRVPYEKLNLVRAWDLASASDPCNDPDYTIGLLMGRDRDTHMLYVIEVIRGRFSPGERQQKIISTAVRDGTACHIRVPQDPGSAGKFEAHHLVGLLQGYRVSTERELGSKENRADPFVAQCEHGFVKLVEAPWNRDFVDELCAFPNGAHDDQVDAASAAFRALVRRPRFSAVGVSFGQHALKPLLCVDC